MSKVVLAYQIAYPQAERIRGWLAPGCERIEIAGSLRRRKQTVGDIEMVCIPRYQTDMFGAPAVEQPSQVDMILAELIRDGRLLPGGKNGKREKWFSVPANYGLMVNLYRTTPEQWGVIFTLRTGPAHFSKQLVTQRYKGGLLSNDCVVSGGRIWQNGRALETPEEENVLKFITGEWIAPERRGE